ncbi:MAG TPA: Vps62-related protein [Gaiellaceae bacterium]|nr:Vps62-related protein [Gaiellaceae bacterium]
MRSPRRMGLLLAAVLALVPSAFARQEATPPLASLLARHVPVLVLHPAEQIVPEPVESFLAYADLQRRTPAGWEKVEGPLPAGGRDLRLDHRLCRAVEGLAATSCYASGQGMVRAAPVVYGAAFRRGSRIELQYWIFYPFNPYSPTVAPAELWQVHEGDWEAVGVVTDARGNPLVAGYSQHSEGERRAWAKVPKEGRRPLVYVALGSHANYFGPGVHRLRAPVVEPLFISVIRQAGYAPVDRTGRGRVVRPRLVRVSASSPSWMAFAGRWGEDQYLRAPGGTPQALGLGPPGPAFQEHWQRPVADVLSWPAG